MEDTGFFMILYSGISSIHPHCQIKFFICRKMLELSKQNLIVLVTSFLCFKETYSWLNKTQLVFNCYTSNYFLQPRDYVINCFDMIALYVRFVMDGFHRYMTSLKPVLKRLLFSARNWFS